MFAFLIVRGKKIKKTLAHTEFKTHFNSFMSFFFFFLTGKKCQYLYKTNTISIYVTNNILLWGISLSYKLLRIVEMTTQSAQFAHCAPIIVFSCILFSCCVLSIISFWSITSLSCTWISVFVFIRYCSFTHMNITVSKSKIRTKFACHWMVERKHRIKFKIKLKTKHETNTDMNTNT